MKKVDPQPVKDDRFLQVIETFPGYVSWISEDNKYLGVNSRLAQAYNKQVEDFKGNDIGFIEGSNPFVDAIHAFKKSDNERYIREIEIVIAGENRWHLLICDKNFFNGELIIVGIDITEQKSAEKALKTSEERFRLLIENSPEAIAILGKDNIVYVNRMLCKMLNYNEPAELLSQDIRKIISEEDRTRFAMQTMISNNHSSNPVIAEEKLIKKGSGHVLVEAVMIPIDFDDQSCTLLFARDITEKKKISELEASKKASDEALKLKQKFIANISHEIRTPMNGVIGLTQLLLKTDLNDQQKEYLNAIQLSANNLLVVINDVLDFEKLQAGKMSLEMTNFKIKDTVQNVIDLLLQKASEKDIQLELNFGKEVASTMIGDPVRLTQILLNLVGNAIKFTEKGYVRLNVRVLCKTEGYQTIEFDVRDTGIGITSEQIATIFEGFTQASDDITRRFGGTGLGLTIAQELVELQGGRIDVQSKVGEGSSFKFSINYKIGSETVHAKIKSKQPSLPEKEFKKANILVVDDNPINLLIATKFLESFGHSFETAENGQDALQKIKNGKFDLVLMDVLMPIMDGYTATKSIRKSFPENLKNIPIIAMTAFAAHAELEKCIESGMNDYISKPFDPMKLKDKIEKALLQTNAKEI